MILFSRRIPRRGGKKVFYVRIQFARTNVTSQAALRDAAKEDGAHHRRVFLWRRNGHRQNGWPQAGARHRGTLRNVSLRRTDDPAHRRAQKTAWSRQQKRPAARLSYSAFERG